MATSEVTLSFREGATERYLLIKTTAPRDYDYGGVLEYYDAGEYRYILVPHSLTSAQEGRNRSGLYTFEFSDDVPGPAISEDLWRKFMVAMQHDSGIN